MTKLSVNINKIATIRNARGGNNPDVIKVALDCEKFGADGITVHPRPDERHIRRSDVYALRPVLTTEFNIEGYPSQDFVDLVLKVKPHQVTLVPDAPDQITSNAGWDTKTHLSFLTDLIDSFKTAGIRTSIFVGTDLEIIDYAAAKGIDITTKSTEGKPSTSAKTARYSTLQDLDAKRKTEIESLAGDLIRMADELGIKIPCCEFTYHMIKAMEEKNSGLFNY